MNKNDPKEISYKNFMFQ